MLVRSPGGLKRELVAGVRTCCLLFLIFNVHLVLLAASALGDEIFGAEVYLLHFIAPVRGLGGIVRIVQQVLLSDVVLARVLRLLESFLWADLEEAVARLCLRELLVLLVLRQLLLLEFAERLILAPQKVPLAVF